jgi:hypothetical protein
MERGRYIAGTTQEPLPPASIYCGRSQYKPCPCALLHCCFPGGRPAVDEDRRLRITEDTC